MFKSADALASLYPSLAKFAITDLGSCQEHRPGAPQTQRDALIARRRSARAWPPHLPQVRPMGTNAARAATKLGCRPALEHRQLALAAEVWNRRKPAEQPRPTSASELLRHARLRRAGTHVGHPHEDRVTCPNPNSCPSGRSPCRSHTMATTARRPPRQLAQLACGGCRTDCRPSTVRRLGVGRAAPRRIGAAGYGDLLRSTRMKTLRKGSIEGRKEAN
jgi:hypothetical protein